ncbi:hypothetical protein OGY83_06565 [Citrobacter sp. Cpo090]|uniref:hypothetical protein n=1 Tax=Citrobacter sp. Cpo090 TaxID=2985139 RepID=UPI0025754197|nr:hypothetical protein [Citrobacter sp. Cpo090]MDM2843293.1 hypothetical protein [Citrobacter sp. Cpo090]
MEKIKAILRSKPASDRAVAAAGLYLHGNWVYILPNEDKFLKRYIRMHKHMAA